jgi:hypothetical protein
MDMKLQHFVKLIDNALQIAEGRMLDQQTGKLDVAPEGALDIAIKNLEEIKNNAICGTLPSFQVYGQLGLTRFVADWDEPLESSLLKAVGAVERYYKENL